MTYENFSKAILKLQKQDRELQLLLKHKVDLLDLVDPYQEIIGTLIKEIYGEEGYDWFGWYCYENDYGTRGLKAWDENKKKICYNHKSLWKHLESIRTKKK